MTKEKVFDGIDTTFFDAPEENGQWVGLDLGSRKVITCIKFRPRKDQENRMRGGQFQISNTADFSHTITIYTIPTDATLSFQDYYITSLNAEGVNTNMLDIYLLMRDLVMLQRLVFKHLLLILERCE